MIETNKDGYIINAVFDGEGLKNPLCDRFGRYQYKVVNKKPVYSPQPYTPEQTEQLRCEWIKAEIETLYPQDIQLKIMMEKDDKPEAYAQMQADRLRIKAESKEKDFQIDKNGG